ncbi:MAG: class I SAM-dependent methyltransferase [Candidatus Hodarchaeales archaeon]|jgi:cyclopropane fatty-acyl-phospholipid synthase-like methyltransferase
MMKLLYEMIYRYFRAPWDTGARKELVSLVTSGKIKPGKAIDLGSGTASNCIFLAENGFDVTGVDYSPTAIRNARRKARDAKVKVNFIVDDLTDLQNVKGNYDLLVDYGTFDDLNYSDRELYIKNTLPLTQPGTKFLFFCFEWAPRWWERLIARMKIGGMALEPGEVVHRFRKYFKIKQLSKRIDFSKYPPGTAVYLMTRNNLEYIQGS